jgi:cytoskeleton protein RodZ
MVAAVRTEPDTAGARLASARERLGLSLDQVADHLKLDRHMVVALEEGDYRAIGATVFVRGFLRRYAALVGESPSEIEALYARLPDAEARPDLSKTGMQRIEPAAFRPSLGVLPALIAALVLAIAGAAWWAMWSKPHVTAPASSALPKPIAAPGAAPGAAPTVAATAPLIAPEAKAVPMAGRRLLELIFAGECWAEIYDARGVRLYFGFGHAGTTQQLSGVAPFRITLANASVVTVAMEGAAIGLPASVPGQRMHILLNANGSVEPIP